MKISLEISRKNLQLMITRNMEGRRGLSHPRRLSNCPWSVDVHGNPNLRSL
jgi:hypothetical protein